MRGAICIYMIIAALGMFIAACRVAVILWQIDGTLAVVATLSMLSVACKAGSKAIDGLTR